MRKIYLLITTIAALTACGDNVTKPIEVPITVALSPDSLMLTVGQTQLVGVTVAGSTLRATYTSSNPVIATVDSVGLVTARVVGTTFVRATVGTASDSSKVIVAAATGTISVTPKSVTLLVGANQALTATVQGPTTAPTFTSLNTTIATVNGAGIVTGTGPGVTYVVANIGTIRDSARIAVVTVASTPAQLPKLGSGAVPERFSAEVAAAGSWAYTTTWGNRGGLSGNAVKIWNVTGNTPILSDSLIMPGSVTTSDVQISDDGKLLAISTEASGVGSNHGFALFDRTATPGKPTLIARYNSPATNPGVHTLKFARINGRHYLFLQIDPPAALVIVDITNPGSPVEVLNRRMGNPYIHDVYVRDGILFAALWNDGMTIFDVGGLGVGGSPSNPFPVGSIRPAACPGCSSAGNPEAHNIWWFNDPRSGDKRYAFVGEEGPASLFTYSKGDIHVVDVSDMRNPREVAFFRPDSATTSTGFQPAGTHNFDVDEQSGILYAAYYNGGVRALDIRGDLGTCTAEQKSADGRCNLRLMGREVGIGLTTSPVFIWGVKVDGSVLYASDMPNGIHKLSIATLKR